MIKVYMLYYNEYGDDDNSRESWSVFYTPCELFIDKTSMDKRKLELTKQMPDVTFYEVENSVPSN